MNSGYFFSSPNSVDHSSPNSMDYPYLAYTNSEEHHPLSSSNTKLPLSRLGVDIGTSNPLSSPNTKLPTSRLGVDIGTSNPFSSSDTKLPMSRLGVDIGTGNPLSSSNTKLPMSRLGVDIGTSNAGQAGGRNVDHLSGRKSRGRPRGAKNKPKENAIDMSSPVNYALLHIPPGSDVVEWVKQFAQSMNVFVNVLAGAGLISQVAYSPSQHPVLLSERLSLVSLTGIVGMGSPPGTGPCSFTAALARLNGIVIGGTVWKLVTMGPVVLSVLTSENPVVIGASN